MKRSVYTTVIIPIVAFSGFGQQNTGSTQSGVIKYEERVKIELKLEGEMAALLKDMPKERFTEKNLHFTSEASSYTQEKSSGNAARTIEGEGITMMVSSGNSDNVIFTDLDKSEITEMRDFMTRKFLIERKIRERNWKITGNRKSIAGFNCIEAVTADTSGRKTSVWFTPDIGIPSGPALYSGLPGMVLEVNEGEGSRIIAAKEIEFRPIKPGEIIKPKEGKKVTEEEFDEIVREKMKEMGSSNVGGVSRVIIRNEE